LRRSATRRPSLVQLRSTPASKPSAQMMPATRIGRSNSTSQRTTSSRSRRAVSRQRRKVAAADARGATGRCYSALVDVEKWFAGRRNQVERPRILARILAAYPNQVRLATRRPHGHPRHSSWRHRVVEIARVIPRPGPPETVLQSHSALIAGLDRRESSTGMAGFKPKGPSAAISGVPSWEHNELPLGRGAAVLALRDSVIRHQTAPRSLSFASAHKRLRRATAGRRPIIVLSCCTEPPSRPLFLFRQQHRS